VASNGSEPRPGGQRARRPVIGLTTYRERAATLVWDTEFALLHHVYVDAVARAGGIPVLLPPFDQVADEDAAAEVIGRLDALVLTGGSDVDPGRYQQQPHEQTKVVRPWRDDWELRLLDHALATGLPVLGVCRGLQLLNVALGGTLDQHLPDTLGHQRHSPAPGVFGANQVTLRAGSVLAGLLGPAATVSCYHHQAIATLAPGLEITGTSDDGTVEGVERLGPGFVLGVQWHPEQDGADLRLFQALVAAAREPKPAGQQPGSQADDQAGNGAGRRTDHQEAEQGASRVGL
jgi:putative glutamine amidotransferase